MKPRAATVVVLPLFLALPACHSLPAPVTEAAEPAQTVSFVLHKFLQPIGSERDTYTPLSNGQVEAKATFVFVDRGTQVPLAATFRLGRDGLPVRYEAWGYQARGVPLDDRVVPAGADGGDSFWARRLGQADRQVRAPAPRALASGYAPVLGQALMARAWVAAGRPAHLALVPEGELTLTGRGFEEYTLEGRRHRLEHVAVDGLVWGREDIWLDDKGALVALATRDAEFDHFEAVRQDLGPLAEALVARAGSDAIAQLATAARGAERQAPGLVALVGGRLIDGTGRPAIEDAVVVYDGARIVAAGPRASTPIPGAAKRIDIAGQTVLPGLWDMHAHFEQVEQAAAYLAAGVTTVRDLGNILPFITAVRDSIDEGAGLGPRILVDGLVDGDGRQTLGIMRIDTPADVPRVIDQLVKVGCREVKVYSSIAPALVKPIADEARRRGLGITGHVPEGMSITEAVEAGLTGIEHIQFAFSAVYQRRDFQKVTPSERRRMLANIDLKSPKMAALFTAMQQKAVVYDPTLALMELFQHTAAENAKSEPGLALEPRGMADGFPGVPPDQAAESAAVFDKELAIVGELHRRGITVVAGTDITVPGHSLHREIELLVRAGFTPMEALQAATSVPARVMHLDGEVGTIAPGKRADLVLVAGNPLADIRDIRKVAGVVTRGRLLDPTALWKLAGFTPPAAGAAHAAR